MNKTNHISIRAQTQIMIGMAVAAVVLFFIFAYAILTR